MDYYVYAIKSLEFNYIYIGQTVNLDERYKRHNNGREMTTKLYRPFTLVHVEIAKNRVEARIIEKFLKSGYGKEVIKEIADVAKLADAQA